MGSLSPVCSHFDFAELRKEDPGAALR